ncbi:MULTISPECIES: hypothetical protein [Actinomycetes]|uniref:hypothetical protein n=1 Tax=Actinomycetes TaxID=1760 RepID=UPI000F957AC7|nr:hypothetical protein [Arthrobacter sp. MYb222]MCS3493476.1 hypothetical protein [Arthrobacter sp. JUb119]
MSLFARKSSEASTHRVQIHFAQPMTERLRKDHEAGLLDTLLPKYKSSGTIISAKTTLDAAEEPISSDINLEVATPEPKKLFSELLSSLIDGGLGHGSWLIIDGQRTEVGGSEYVLLRTRLGAESESDLEPTVRALQHALGDGEIGWHEDVYYRHDGPVFVYNGDSAQAIIHTLETELVKHPLLGNAEILSVSPQQ